MHTTHCTSLGCHVSPAAQFNTQHCPLTSPRSYCCSSPRSCRPIGGRFSAKGYSWSWSLARTWVVAGHECTWGALCNVWPHRRWDVRVLRRWQERRSWAAPRQHRSSDVTTDRRAHASAYLRPFRLTALRYTPVHFSPTTYAFLQTTLCTQQCIPARQKLRRYVKRGCNVTGRYRRGPIDKLIDESILLLSLEEVSLSWND